MNGGLNLLAKGTRALLDGDFEKIGQYVRSRALNKVSWSVTDSDARSPAWIDNDETAVRQRSGVHEYVLTVAQDETTGPVTLAPPTTVDEVLLQLVNMSDVASLSLDVVGSTPDGREIQQTADRADAQWATHERWSVSIGFPAPVETVEISIEDVTYHEQSAAERLIDRVSPQNRTPHFSAPAIRPTTPPGPPIIVISIDTWRYDHLDAFAPVLEAMGDDAYVPAEPRTQGHWTRPSHASTLTGVHTAEHGYVVGRHEDIPEAVIAPELRPLSEILYDVGYTTRGLVSTLNIAPAYGFGRGFHTFDAIEAVWGERERDASNTVDEVLRYLDADARRGAESLFYFVHLYDPHIPYIPPEPDVTHGAMDYALAERVQSQRPPKDYVRLYRDGGPEPAESDLDTLLEYYRSSVEYTSRQVVRLIDALRRYGYYDDAFIVICGDHGEEFFERGFAGHMSLNDENIRPGAIIKPPSDASWAVPDAVDYIDLVPTVCELVGIETPSYCQGRAWQSDAEPDYRLTEAITPTNYIVAAEHGGRKGQFIYPADNFPDLPTSAELEAGPIYETYCSLSDVREGNYQEPTDITSEQKAALRESAAEFAGRTTDTRTHAAQADFSADVDERLSWLGYK